MRNLPAYRKTLAALLGAVSTAVAQGLIAGDAAKWASIAIGFVTAAFVFATPNEPTAPVADEDGYLDRGAVDAGSLALGLLLGIVLAVLLWGR